MKYQIFKQDLILYLIKKQAYSSNSYFDFIIIIIYVVFINDKIILIGRYVYQRFALK